MGTIVCCDWVSYVQDVVHLLFFFLHWGFLPEWVFNGSWTLWRASFGRGFMSNFQPHKMFGVPRQKKHTHEWFIDKSAELLEAGFQTRVHTFRLWLFGVAAWFVFASVLRPYSSLQGVLFPDPSRWSTLVGIGMFTGGNRDFDPWPCGYGWMFVVESTQSSSAQSES